MNSDHAWFFINEVRGKSLFLLLKESTREIKKCFCFEKLLNYYF